MDKRSNLSYASDNVMKFTMLCTRMNSTAGHAPLISASKAETNERGLIENALFYAPRMLKVIDIVHKNSVLAEQHVRMRRYFRGNRGLTQNLYAGETRA
jgi:hypothetical protein